MRKNINYLNQITEIQAKMPPAARGSFEKRAEIPLDPTKLFIICLLTIFARGFTHSKSRKEGHFLVFILVALSLGGLLVSGSRLQARENPQTWKNRPEKVKVGEDFSFIYQQDGSSQLTVIHLLVKGGKAAVPISQRGLAFLTTRLAVELPTAESLNRLMQSGATLLYHVEGDYVTISLRSLSANLEEALKIVSRVIKKPLFSGLRIDSVKQYMVHRQKSEEDSPEQLMELTLGKAFSSPYAGSIFGDDDTLKNLKKKDIADFYHRFFNHRHMIIAVSSDLAKPVLTPIIAKYFSSFPPGEAEPVEPVQAAAAVPGPREFFFNKEQQQVLISFGAVLPGISRKHFALASIMESLMGEGIGSKLWPLRAKKELAYSLKSRFIQWKNAGLFTIFLKTGVSKKAEAYRALKDLITDLYHRGVSEDDLIASQVLCRADFLRNNETKERRTQQLAHFEALGVGYDFLEDFFSQVDRVTREEFNQYLKQALNPAHLLEVVIGPGVESRSEASLKTGTVGSITKN
jgi:zinc protease